MTKLRGTPQTATAEYKPYALIKSHRYDGPINRDYERLARYSITYPGKVPYTVSSAKDHVLLQAIIPMLGTIAVDKKREVDFVSIHQAESKI